MHNETGHRKRVRDRFRVEGLDGFDEVHVLELLLFYAIAQRDTKPLARMLLDHFGSLPQVLEAPVEALIQVPGMGENTALYLNLIMATGRYYALRKADRPVILDSSEKCCHYLMDFFMGMRNETVYLLCLDAKCKVLCCRKVGEGDVNSANVPMRRVAEIALSTNATTVILAHNHPSGVALPSYEDVQTTERLAIALGSMDIILADHVVVADEDCISMTQSRLFDPRNFSRLI